METTTTVTTRRSVDLNEDQITAIVKEHLARVWGVPVDAISGDVSATDYGARVEAVFSHERIVRT
jgi:hypothetical protein